MITDCRPFGTNSDPILLTAPTEKNFIPDYPCIREAMREESLRVTLIQTKFQIADASNTPMSGEHIRTAMDGIDTTYKGRDFP